MKKNLIIVLLGVGLIVYASTVIASRNTIYYYTTSETEDIEITTNERIKLGGFVVEGSISKDGGYTVFTITDGNKEIDILFDGFIPELFQENMGVILDGVLDNNIFFADDMLVKHDNEYVSSDGETYDVKSYSK
ncbi:cytochrome c maturation protein CcmE [Acidimicrobiaceae bacterium]|nr:cytochrome c maturation protein CcmE [Acidimicrobiaceae bacterium]